MIAFYRLFQTYQNKLLPSSHPWSTLAALTVCSLSKSYTLNPAPVACNSRKPKVKSIQFNLLSSLLVISKAPLKCRFIPPFTLSTPVNAVFPPRNSQGCLRYKVTSWEFSRAGFQCPVAYGSLSRTANFSQGINSNMSHLRRSSLRTNPSEASSLNVKEIT